MDRRQFIQGVMAAVTASYASGSLLLEGSKFTWLESVGDFGHMHRMAVQWTDAAGLDHGMVVVQRLSGQLMPEIRDKMKKKLLNWLEENVDG